MTKIRTIEAAREWKTQHNEELNRLHTYVITTQEQLQNITNNTLYKLLPSWIREKIEAIFEK